MYKLLAYSKWFYHTRSDMERNKGGQRWGPAAVCWRAPDFPRQTKCYKQICMAARMNLTNLARDHGCESLTKSACQVRTQKNRPAAPHGRGREVRIARAPDLDRLRTRSAALGLTPQSANKQCLTTGRSSDAHAALASHQQHTMRMRVERLGPLEQSSSLTGKRLGTAHGDHVARTVARILAVTNRKDVW